MKSSRAKLDKTRERTAAKNPTAKNPTAKNSTAKNTNSDWNKPEIRSTEKIHRPAEPIHARGNELLRDIKREI